MRAILASDTLQIEWTSRCVLSCSDCTHFSGSYYQHPELSFEQFRDIVDSLEGYPGMIGAIGGDPVITKDFERMCLYAQEKIPREQHGLWTTFPKGYEHFRELICATFGNILLNDHTMKNIMHAPILVAIDEVVPDEDDMFLIVDQCWLANRWSPVVNGKGAYFCEVAGSMAQLFQGSDGWKLEPGWWKKTPKDYGPQMSEFCRKCGCALPLTRRPSVDGRDDISPGNMERLKGKSRKVDKGKVVVSTFEMDPLLQKAQQEGGGLSLYPEQVYKQTEYRRQIAAKYGIVLVMNQRGYWDPRLKETVPYLPAEPPKAQSLFNIV